MKKLFAICLLLFIAVLCNAQNNNKPKYNELNHDQLNIAFKQASEAVKTGKILTFIGAGAFVTGSIIFSNGLGDLVEGSSTTENKLGGGYALIIVGMASTITGAIVWGHNKKKKDYIELELVKFNPKGSASINGIGIKVRF